MNDALYYDADGFAVTLGYERYGPISPLRSALQRTKRLISRSLDYPVREMSDLILAEALKGISQALASADTHPEGGDSTEIEAPFMSGAVAAKRTDAQRIEPND